MDRMDHRRKRYQHHEQLQLRKKRKVPNWKAPFGESGAKTNTFIEANIRLLIEPTTRNRLNSTQLTLMSIGSIETGCGHFTRLSLCFSIGQYSSSFVARSSAHEERKWGRKWNIFIYFRQSQYTLSSFWPIEQHMHAVANNKEDANEDI